MLNKGLLLELEFVKYFHNKRFMDLSPKWKSHFKVMFPNIRKKERIKSYKYKDQYAKPDIVIEACGKKILLSIKTGSNPTMHYERFSSFYSFLKGLGVPYDILSTITLYHFGNAKRYSNDEKILSKEEIVENYKGKIIQANQYLNKEEIVRAVIKRSIIKGAIDTRESINYFYYGVLTKGFLCSKKDIKTSVLSREAIHSDFIHFGELVYQPAARNRKSNDYLYSTIHWPVLSRLFYEVEDENNIMYKRKTNAN